VKYQDLAGRIFGRLCVVGFARRERRESGSTRVLWHTVCECGSKRITPTSDLLRGACTSCGCAKRDRLAAGATHGETRGRRMSVEYRTWALIIARCTNPKATGYKNYGGRRIFVCKEWRNNFSAFLSSIGRRPSVQHSIERINNNKGYKPGNCRWATREEQGANKRNNHLLKHRGKTLHVSAWARELGVHVQTILWRLKAGKSVAQALKGKSV